MATEVKNDIIEKEPKDPPTAEPKKTDTDHMIPKERFDEVNQKWKDEVKAREASDKALKEAQTTRLKEKEDYKVLFEQATKELGELKPKAESFDSYKETMKNLFETQKEEIPEELRSLIPEELTVKQKIDWIAKNKKLLLKPVGPDIGAGLRGAGGGDVKLELTPEERQVAKQFGYTDKEYADAKAQGLVK